MAEINKFTEERNGCKSVMHKRSVQEHFSMKNKYISIDPTSKTFDIGNTSQGSILAGSHSPVMFNDSAQNSPMIFEHSKSRQL